MQEIDGQLLPDMSQLKVVTEKSPTQEEMEDLIFCLEGGQAYQVQRYSHC